MSMTVKELLIAGKAAMLAPNASHHTTWYSCWALVAARYPEHVGGKGIEYEVDLGRALGQCPELRQAQSALRLAGVALFGDRCRGEEPTPWYWNKAGWDRGDALNDAARACRLAAFDYAIKNCEAQNARL